MKYYQWQNIHKAAYVSYNRGRNSQEEKNLSLIEIHERAWQRLNKYCNQDELFRLLKLALQYDCGHRLPDTHFVNNKTA
ncbi:MAG TPA: hypothetical protein VH186_26685 [Chloroflexia bacterium]|nr:hypothetical protein [Chloroflexia bacterium]